MCPQDWPHACLLFDVFLLSSVVRYFCVIIGLAWESAHVSQPEYDVLHLSKTLICMSGCRCLDWEVPFQIRQLLMAQPHMLDLPK